MQENLKSTQIINNDKARERRIYWRGFAVRCFLGLTAWWVGTHTNLLLMQDADARDYEEVARYIANQWWTQGSSPMLEALRTSGTRTWGIYFILAIFSFLMGGIQVIPVLVALFSLVTAWAPVITYRICRQLEILPRAAFFAAMLVTFSPAFAFWGGSLFKDGLVFLVLNLIIYHILRLQRAMRWKSVFWVVFCIAALLALRFYLAVILVPCIGLGLLLGGTRRGTGAAAPVFLRQVFIIAVLVILIGAFGLSGNIQRIFSERSQNFFNGIQIGRDYAIYAADSGYLPGADVSTPQAALRFLPIGSLYFLTVPHPWHFGSLRNNLAIPETVFWVLLYPLVLIGMRRGLRQNFQASLFLISIVVVLICFYGVTMANAGTAYRMRSQVWLVFVIFIAWAKEKKYLKRVRRNTMQ